jgi:hypothetical protein
MPEHPCKSAPSLKLTPIYLSQSHGAQATAASKETKEQTASLRRQPPWNAKYPSAPQDQTPNADLKNAIAKLWQKEWRNTPKVGRFAISNRLPPSLNPTKHFRHLKDSREVFGRVLQCRSGHAYTGEFRQSFLPLSPDPTACQCDNETLETRNHILIDCPRYEHHRKILKKASKYLFLPVILGTDKGIAALAKFIHKSGAFSRTGTPLTAPQPPSLINEPIPVINPPLDPTIVFDDGG